MMMISPITSTITSATTITIISAINKPSPSPIIPNNNNNNNNNNNINNNSVCPNNCHK